MKLQVALVILCISAAQGRINSPQSAQSSKCAAGSIKVNDSITLEFCDEHIVRVIKTPEGASHDDLVNVDSLMVDPDWTPTGVAPQLLQEDEKVVVYASTKLLVSADKTTGIVTFSDKTTGEVIKVENGHSFEERRDFALGEDEKVS